MKKVFKSIVMLLVLSTALCNESKAQIFKDLFNSAEDVVTSLTGGITISNTSLAGTWDYVKPAIKVEGENPLSNAAATLAVTQMESQIVNMCAQVGIAPGLFKLTFTKEGTFACTVKGVDLKGTYTANSKDNTVTLHFNVVNAIEIGSLKARAVINISSLSLLFEAKALIALVKKLADGIETEEFKAISTILSEYDGLSMGVELSR